MVVHTYNPRAKKTYTEGSLGLAGQPTMLSEFVSFMFREKPVSKKKKIGWRVVKDI